MVRVLAFQASYAGSIPVTRSSQWAGQTHLLRKHLLPTFEAAKLASIQPADVRKWYGRVTDGTSPLTAAKAYRLLRAVFNTAIRDGLLAANPCNIEGAGVERSPERPLIDAETVFDLADATDARYRTLI